MAIKTIGSTGDYATIALWEDATDNVLSEIEEGRLQNQTHSLSSKVTFAGATTTSSFYRKLTCVPGASFRNHASVQTNALRYNASNGAAISSTVEFDYALLINENFFRLEGIQLQGLAGGNGGAVQSASSNVQIDFCILEGDRSANVFQISGGSAVKVRNSLIVQRTSGAAKIALFGFAEADVVNVTFATPSDLTATTDAMEAANPVGGGFLFKNCAFFGAANVNSSGSPTYITCRANDTTPPSGVTTTTYANQFENTAASTRDFRLKSGSNLIDTGTTDSTNAGIDIAGTSRPQGSAYDVGAWEFVVAGGAATKYWSVPTSASNGTVAELVVMADNRQSVFDVVIATASGGVFLAECSNQNNVTGSKRFAMLHDWNESTSTTLIRGGVSIAEVIEV